MAAEYSANATQTVEVNAPVIFTESPVPCNRGLIFHRDESGVFQLANNSPVRNCGCESISVRNTSTQAIDVQNANLTVDYIGVRRAL